MRLSLVVLSLGSALAAQGSGLPPVPVPPQNPITPAKTILGKLLFWEEQMSTDNRVACGTCHTFAAGGGDLRRVRHPGADGIVGSPDDKFGSPGIRRSDPGNRYLWDPDFGNDVQVTPRATPSFLTAAWFPELFWDGRARSNFVDPQTGQTLIPFGGALERQAVAPILAQNEMAHDARTWAQATSKLQNAEPMALATDLPPDMAAAIQNGESYPDLFQAAFGSSAITAQRIAYALATYQRTLVPNQSPFDLNQMSPQAQQGFNIFNGAGLCAQCHSHAPGPGGGPVPGLFSDRSYRNLGLRPIAEDNGRQSVTNNPGDGGRFKVPSLRNVALRRSFMHEGQFTTLGQVIQFYRQRGGPNLQNKDPILQQINLPPPGPVDQELIAFMQALTDPRVAAGAYPFDRPTLRSDLMPPQGYLYGGPTAGTGNQLPDMLAGVPANVGSNDFKIGIADARGGSVAALLVSSQQGFSLEFGALVFVNLGASAVIWASLSGPPGAAGEGYGTIQFPLPADPGLVGLTGYAQWLVVDPGSFGGLAASHGAEIRLF